MNLSKEEALRKSQDICARSERCCADIKNKHKQWGISHEDSEAICELLIHDKFIDETRYAKSFAKDKFRFQKWGKIKISFQLKSKSLHSDIIIEALNNINQEDYAEMLEHEISQKAHSLKEKDPFKRKVKLMRFASQRGYESELAFEIIERALKDSTTKD